MMAQATSNNATMTTVTALTPTTATASTIADRQASSATVASSSLNDECELSVMSKAPPAVTPSPDEIETMLAQQMAQASMKDREEASLEIHGVSDEVEETPEMIQSAMNDLLTEMDQLPNKEAYDLAKRMNRCYVESETFQLMFLRANRFHAKNTALCLARHFQSKLELFGPEKLARDIVQDDLDRDDIDALYSGTTQWLPVRDRPGRLVFLYGVSEVSYKFSEISKMRRSFYTSTVLARDAETQKKGVVAVIFAGNTLPVSNASARTISKRLAWRLLYLVKGMPLRVNAFHFCYNSLAYLPVLAMIRLSMSFFLHVQTHYGSREHCLASLKSYGIPVEVFPVSEDGESIQDVYFKGILEKRRREERRMNQSDAIITVGVPSRIDILFGRGRKHYQHAGNLRYRRLVGDCKSRYDRAVRNEKSKICNEILSIVHQAGGRFLKEDDEIGWVEVSDEIAATKISQAFRTMRSTELSKPLLLGPL